MTSISKHVYIDKLDDIVHKYSNKKHRTIKMKPIDVKDNTYIDFGKEVNDNDPKFKVGDHVRISKFKNIFAKGYTPNWSEEVFGIKKIRNTVPWTYVIDDLNGEEITGTFYEKELQKIDQQEFRIEKVIKKKVINYMSNGKDMIIHLIVGLIPKPYKPFGRDINVNVDSSNYAAKADSKNVSHVSSFALKSNLASLKTEVDKIDAGKFKTVPVGLATLSTVVKNDVVKNTEYNKLVTKVGNIDTTNFVKKKQIFL